MVGLGTGIPNMQTQAQAMAEKARQASRATVTPASRGNITTRLTHRVRNK